MGYDKITITVLYCRRCGQQQKRLSCQCEAIDTSHVPGQDCNDTRPLKRGEKGRNYRQGNRDVLYVVRVSIHVAQPLCP